LMKRLSILGVVLLLAGCNTMVARKDRDLDAGPRTVKVDRQDLVGYSFFDGEILVPPGITATAYSPYDLPISEVLVTMDEKVGKGETLIKLSMPDVQAALAQAKANLVSAQTSYKSALSTDTSVREAKLALEAARSAERIARAQMSPDMEAEVTARKMAEEALRLAIAERDARLAPEREAVAAANAYLKEVQSGAKLSLIRAPISGTITMLDAKPGEVAKTRKPLATVTDLRSLRIQGFVPAEHSDLVKKGVKVMITVEGVEGDPIEGTVQEITVSPPRDGQKSNGYVARIDFPNAEGKVRPGSVIKRLGVATGKAEDVLTVPVSAVMKDSKGIPVVKVQSGSDWVEKPVETGVSDGALIEIKSGLNEGDTVLAGN